MSPRVVNSNKGNEFKKISHTKMKNFKKDLQNLRKFVENNFEYVEQNFANTRSPANLTMTARTASKFCARTWSRSIHIFDLEPISQVIAEK